MQEPLSILLIEDDVIDQIAFRKFTSTDEFRASLDIAPSVAVAREMLATRNYDVIVSDYNLPDGKAFDVVPTVGDRIFILITGSGDEETAIKALRAGVSDYLVKDAELKYLRALPSRIEMAIHARDTRAELRESEERLRDIFDNTSDLIQSVTQDGRIQYANRSWLQTLGYTASELSSLNMFDLLPEERREHFRAIIRRILAGEDTGLLEISYRARDSHSVSLEGTMSAQFRNGKAIAVKGIFRNVTERNLKNEQLKLLENCLSRINDIVMITEAEPIDEPGPKIVYVNNAYEKITGYSREETLGHSPRILQGPLTDKTECKRIREGLQRWETTTSTLLNYRKDGRTFWNEMTIAPVADSTGWFTHWVSIERDITERKETEKKLRDLTGNLERLVKERTGALVESEERFRQMADAINECFCMMDIATHRFLYVSPAYARIWRRSCQSLYEHPQDWFDCVHPDDRKRVSDSFASGSGAQNEIDYRIILGGGSVRWIHSRVFFVLNPQGEPYRLVCVASDITESKQMRDQMLRAQRLESLGTLSGGVAHDLNNALSPILMGLDLLRHKYPADADIIDTMETSGKRGASMVGQLLTFAKGVDGERVLIHPARLIREIGKLIIGTFPKNISLETRLPETEECILGDATQLHQVLLNLCVNARDAMPAGGTLRLEMRNVDLTVEAASTILNAKPGRYVEWRVTDTGTGIAPDVIERIFEPFFTTKAIDKGTGLGLSTVLGIIRSHNGCITVQSTQGEGSTFSVYLPVATDSAIESATAPSNSPSGFRGNGELVLVVDDERSIREMTRAVLHTLGFNVLTARDGTEAIVHVAESRTDLRLVITDLHMPHMDGLGFARLLRRMTPTTKLIAASGRMDDSSLAEFNSIGVDAVLQKPFTQDNLITAIRKALSS